MTSRPIDADRTPKSSTPDYAASHTPSYPSVTDDKTPRTFWVLGAVLTICVFLCTQNRDRIWAADAWEHHRAILTLTQQLWQPGNPTLATSDPSIRYSPYTVTIAVFCRVTGVDPFAALTLAATINTALLVIGIALLMKRLGESSSATAVLVVMIGLWGGPPGYANSYALADLPWHQVNPSAFSFAIVLVYWAVFLPACGFAARSGDRETASGDPRVVSSRRYLVPTIVTILLATIATLDHPMTGVFGLFGLFMLAVTGPGGFSGAFKVIGIGAVAMVICLAWPWYSFLEALHTRRDYDYWFNPVILRMMLFEWCTPALLCGLLALTLRERPAVKRCLIAAAGGFWIGILAMAIKSPSLARFPMPAMIFLHIPVGILVHQSGVLRPNDWARRLRSIARDDTYANARAILETAAFAVVLFFLIPQIIATGNEWHLGRPYLAQLLGKPDKQPHVKPIMDKLLAPVGVRDVILSDRTTSWPMPSSRGRIVAALHLEAFVDTQAQRKADVDDFFSAATNDDTRRRTLAKYNVRWIVLNRQRIGNDAFMKLYRENAVVDQQGGLVLMDARLWLQ